MDSQKIQGKFLRKLFADFEAAGIEYGVLRNYETLPEHLDGSDLDIAILPAHRDEAVAIVMKVASIFGAQPIVDYTCSGRFVRLMGNHEGVWWGAAVDLFSKIEYRGVEYISCSKIIKCCRLHHGIKVIRDNEAAVVTFVKELLANGRLRKNYYEQAREANHTDAGLFRELLKGGGGSLDDLNRILVSGRKDQTEIEKLSRQLRKDVLRSGGKFHFRVRLQNFLLRCRRVFKTPGISIAMMGTDGSGKTTIIEAIAPCLEEALHSKLQYEHLRPNWLPDLGVVFGKKESGVSAVVSDPHAQKPSGMIGSMIRLLYYSLDYTMGFWMKVYPRLVKRPHICIFDRYHGDFIIDPKRMRICLSGFVIKLALVFAPKPNLTLCLGGEPEVIYRRKPETSVTEVERQINELRKFTDKNTKALWIDTGGSIENSVDQVLKNILRVMSSR